MNKEVLVTGIRSTGELHVGNYYGVLKGLIELQKSYKAFYFIADIHSLTTHPNPKEMKERVFSVAKDYLAAGLAPEQAVFYLQSSIAGEVSELSTYLGMVMPLGDLLRCPTFKEKAKKYPNNVNYGLVGYPILMAADIIIHNARIVPVGDDQLVHLEIARTIVRKFHHIYGEIFVEPQPVMGNAVRIPSLMGKGKMSKSDHENSYIGLDESLVDIQSKMKKAYSDPLRIYKDQPGHPTAEGCNVFHLHTFFTEENKIEEIKQGCQKAEIGCVACKQILAKSMNNVVEPIREKRKNITDDYIHDVLLIGKEKAKKSANETIAKVRKKMGLQIL